jgi:hypothetical protein
MNAIDIRPVINASTLRPGLLVSLKTSVRGNVRYNKEIIEERHVDDDGVDRTKWATERLIADPVEHKIAKKVRSKARSIIGSVCAHSAFGFLCPEADEAKLAAATAEARELVEDFNGTASLTRVSIYVMVGRVAADDVEAVRAINSEVRDLLAAMSSGLKNLDVKVVRDAADRARDIGSMLSEKARERIQVAIDTARASARAIVKAGEQGAVEIDKQAIRKITAQRTAFLDLDEEREIAAPRGKARALDLAPVEPEIAPRRLKTPAARRVDVD